MQRYLEVDLDPSWKGIALFSCASEDFFLPIPLPLPPENSLTLSPYPHLFSLIRQTDLYQTHAVIAADSRQARLFLMSQGRPEKQIFLSWEDKHPTRFGRMGWSHQKFQRHIQEHVKQRAKETVENLENLLQRKKAEYLFTVAEEGMESELKKRLSASLRQKLAPLTSLDPHDPDYKILTGAFEALQKISREKAEAFAKQIVEEAEPLGQATAGPEPTLSALQNHQIERLVFDGRFKATGWRCGRCGSLGIGGSPRACPSCQGEIRSADLREEMVLLAELQGIELSFTENFPLLVRAGGIGALLKFKKSSKAKRQTTG